MGVGLAWQVLFLLLSTDPVRYRPMILPSILEKISFGIALIVVFAQGRVPMSTFAVGSVDWNWAFLFLAAYYTTQPTRASS